MEPARTRGKPGIGELEEEEGWDAAGYGGKVLRPTLIGGLLRSAPGG